MQHKKPDIHRILDFQRLLLKFQAIERGVDVPPTFRQENDTEHSYNLALTAWFLAGHFPELDRDRLLRFALAHDLVEIHAGDTYIYGDQTTIESKATREIAALDLLATEWPDFPDLIATIHEYERKDTPEARFIFALDKIMPIMLLYIGESPTWRREGITLDKLHAAKRDKVATFDSINEYYQQLYVLLIEKREDLFAA